MGFVPAHYNWAAREKPIDKITTNPTVQIARSNGIYSSKHACPQTLGIIFAAAGVADQSPEMGRVRTKTVKKSSRVVIERYYSRMTLDFHTNKKILEEVAIIPSKRLRNKIAGFSTHLMKRIQRGPVRGISLKLQEEERERRMDFVPPESAIKTDLIEVDKETIEMLAALGMSDLPGVTKQPEQPVGGPVYNRPPYGGGVGGGGGRRQ